MPLQLQPIKPGGMVPRAGHMGDRPCKFEDTPTKMKHLWPVDGPLYWGYQPKS